MLNISLWAKNRGLLKVINSWPCFPSYHMAIISFWFEHVYGWKKHAVYQLYTTFIQCKQHNYHYGNARSKIRNKMLLEIIKINFSPKQVSKTFIFEKKHWLSARRINIIVFCMERYFWPTRRTKEPTYLLSKVLISWKMC